MKKSDLKSYLDYYIRLNSPGYAVLIIGEWGSGKTHQVLKALPPARQCHVSLFGISNSQEIYSTVFAKMYPGRNAAKKIMELAKDMTGELNGITFGAGSIVGSIANAVIKQTVDKDKIIIFDDLERCLIPNKDILGVINQYVEHHQSKVIILAHDILLHDDFITTKEKIIGHTIQVEPQIDEAASLFFTENHNLNNYNEIKKVIVTSFKKTNCKSLRILKCLINDCNRLLSCLEPIHIRNTQAMQSLFSFFCIVNIVHRAGDILGTDIHLLPKVIAGYSIIPKRKEEITPEEQQRINRLKNFRNKYHVSDITSDVLTGELLESILITGRYPSQEIIKTINTSRYFLQNNTPPPWLTIINFDHVDTVRVRTAINEMLQGFENYKIIEIEDIMHSFCLSYLLSENNEIPYSFDELYESQISYIESILKKGLLPPEPLYFDPFHDSIYERGGTYAYWINDTYRTYIDNLINHIKKSRKLSKIQNHPNYTKDILTALDTDLDHFEFLLLGNGDQAGIYSNIDILKYIDPEEFLLHWLMLPIESWFKVDLILTSRYRGAANSVIKNEKLWLSELCIHLIFEAKLNTGVDRMRLERLAPYPALRMF